MKSLTTLARYIRYPLIGSLIALCSLFYFRKLEGPPFPLLPDAATELCTTAPGCKAMSFAHRYDPALHRQVIAVRIVMDKKQRKSDAPAQLLRAIDERQANRAGLKAWGWTSHRLEVRYE